MASEGYVSSFYTQNDTTSLTLTEETHTKLECSYRVIEKYINAFTKLYIHVRQCVCSTYQNGVIPDGLVVLPKDGVDVHSLPDCRYEATERLIMGNGTMRRIKFLKLRCFCAHEKQTVKMS